VILCAGAIGSPQLLLLSGIGPKEEIVKHGLAVVHELPGVGRNLQDHLDVIVTTRNTSRLAISFHPRSLWRAIRELFRYLFFKRGDLTSNTAEAGAFTRSAPSEPIPDLQYHFVVGPNTRHAQDLVPLFGYAYSLHVCVLRPKSRGTVTLRSADPLAPPVIQPDYCADPADFDKLIAGFKQARHILAQAALAPHRGEELDPGPKVQDDEQVRSWIRANAETIYHPAGTCKMGRDELAVVDAELRVRGIRGLRVADASIMPTLIGGNTNAPTTMIAEKAASILLQEVMAQTVIGA
jgi:choline dehydrogenase